MRAGIIYVMFTIKSYCKKPSTVPDTAGGFTVRLGHDKETRFYAKSIGKILKGFKQRSFVIGFMFFKTHLCNLL